MRRYLNCLALLIATALPVAVVGFALTATARAEEPPAAEESLLQPPAADMPEPPDDPAVARRPDRPRRAPLRGRGLDADQPPPPGHPGAPLPPDGDALSDGPEPPHRPFAPRDLWARLTDEEKTAVEQFIEENFPLLHEELQRAKDEGVVRFERRMQRIAPEMRRLMELMQHQPDRARLIIRERATDMRFRRAAFGYRQAESDERREALRQQLSELAQQAFDIRIQRREMEIRDLEQRIAELRARIDEARTNRDQLVAEELERALNAKAPLAPESEDGDRPERGRPAPRRPDH